ncbi:hypothetical protein TH2_147 [Shewanella phage Thanatos-2]|nr:hypothetical protein TH2_147 [Shewanella phage Thanatos-2]
MPYNISTSVQHKRRISLDIVNSESSEAFDLLLCGKYKEEPEEFLDFLKTVYNRIQAIKHIAIKSSLETIKEWSEDNNSHDLLYSGICENFGNLIGIKFNTALEDLEQDFKKFDNLRLMPSLHLFVYDLSADILDEYIVPLFEKWSKFSGDISYPVPSPDQSLDEYDIYWISNKDGRLWIGEYGDLRKELLNFLITKFY